MYQLKQLAMLNQEQVKDLARYLKLIQNEFEAIGVDKETTKNIVSTVAYDRLRQYCGNDVVI